LIAESATNLIPFHDPNQPPCVGECIGSPVTRIVKSFEELERIESMKAELDRKKEIAHKQKLQSKQASKELWGSLSPDHISIAQVGAAADKAKCQALKRQLAAEKTMAELRAALKSFERARKIRAARVYCGKHFRIHF